MIKERSVLVALALLGSLFLVFGPPMAAAAPFNSTLVKGNNAFACDIYKQVSERPGNLILSPYSISSALAMAYAGAKGKTASQMAETFRYALPQDELHKAFGHLNTLLNEGGKPYKLSVANALWSQEGLDFVKDYIGIVQENYGEGFRLVDFVNKTEEARATINKWVEQMTENRIVELIKPDILNPLTRLVLTNAIYFKGQWEHQFNKELTQIADFYMTTKETVQVPFMHLQESVGYVEGNGFRAVELPYSGNELSMIVILPDLFVGISAFESNLDYEKLQAIIQMLRPASVNISIPKFKFETELGLSGYLQRMGMTDAFSDSLADFSGISDTFLYITAVIHKAFIEVNEEGSEAAAATAVVMGTKSIDIPKQFFANRPFFFIIRDKRSESILFVGRVTDPRN